MTPKRLLIGAAALLALVISVIRLTVHATSEEGVNRRPVTVRRLECAECGVREPITQKELMRLYRPDLPRDAQGQVLVPCPKCRAVAAHLVVDHAGKPHS